MKRKALQDNDRAKTKDQLIKELGKLRRQITKLEKSGTERKRADEQVLKQSAVLEAINKVFRETFICETDEEVARTCLTVAEELTGSKFGFIGEVNKEGRFDTIALSYPGWDACRVPKSDGIILIKDMEIRGIWGRVIKDERSLIVNDPSSHPSRVGTPKGHPPIACFLGAPLKRAGRTIGMIALANKELGYRLADQEAVEALSVAFVEALHRKRAEEALRESEERFRAITESTSDAIIAADSQGKIIFWNVSAKNTFGYEEEEMLGKPVHVLLPERFRDTDRKGMEEFLETATSPFIGRAVESICLKKDGSEFPAELSRFGWKAGSESFIGAIIRDITERKRVDEALRESEERFQQVAENAQVWVWEVDDHGLYTYSSSIVEKILGYKTDEVVGEKHFYDLFLPEDRESLKKAAFEVFTKKESFHEFINRNVRKDGKTVWLSTSGVPMLDDQGNLLGYRGKDTDITERKQAEEALRESEERLRSIMENANDAIFFVDSRGNIRFFNRKAEELYGYTADEIVGKPHSVLIPERLQEIHRTWMEKFLSLDKSAISGKIVEGIGERKDGSEFYVETSTALLKQRGETYLVAILRDITERKKAEEEKAKLEEQLRQSQKMEAVGLLAGGIAHDFNNILTAIIGYASLLQMKLQEDDPLRTQAGYILNSANRGANLTQGLLAFGRKQIINPKPVKVNEVINKVEKLLTRVIGEDIELKVKLTDKDTTVMADSVQIEQVLMNLATNARDAMPEGGHLIIGTERKEIDRAYIRTHGYGKPGEYVFISISDSGAGMDDETREKIFEPFFTTKEVGKGTGLGLAMVYGTVKQHNGHISCYSEPGKGTTFKIYIPLYKGEAIETATQWAAPTTTSMEGTETILIAEDDSDVRKLTEDVLKRFGYTVIEAVDGEDAIRAFKENKEKIQLLLLDVIMPKKNGKEAYDEMKKIRPDIKVLFISGYTANIIHKRGMLEVGLDFILKPVSPTELLRKVREVLDKQ
jgi:PAS domain S-box-containing protein